MGIVSGPIERPARPAIAMDSPRGRSRRTGPGSPSIVNSSTRVADAVADTLFASSLIRRTRGRTIHATDLSRAVTIARSQLDLGGVAVVGAGLSIDARFPMTSGLNVLLWDALDCDPVGRAEVAHALGRPDIASKKLVGDDAVAVALAWSALRRRPEGRSRFQSQFTELDRERSGRPSPAHEALARFVHAGIVQLVVSLNWDTALERAYERLFGVSLPAGVLHKPHGDAADPESPWVLPDQPGRITPELRATADALASTYARTLLIVGYSSSDAVVVDELIRPLDNTWRTIRVGPSAQGRDDVTGLAADVLPMLAESLARQADASSWHTVTFNGSRGIAAAFRGERLSPLDVNACPELVEAELLHRSLLEDHAVVLNGPTGSGKSISAYQALRKLASSGYEVLRLRDNARNRGVCNWASDLRLWPWPKVLFIDDAQDITADEVREFSEHADDQTLILFAGIDHVAGGVRTLRLGAGAAVARLAQWVRDEREASFIETKALDDQVGSYPRDVQFEYRVSVAEQQPTPWLFFYILTGGWRRIGRELLELRDADRADLLLLTVAVAQIASVDAGVSEDGLHSWSRHIGKDASWTTRALRVLRDRRLLNESDGQLRCSHLQTAFSIVRWMMHIPPANYTPSVRNAVTSIKSATAAVAHRAAAVERTKGVTQDVSQAQIREDRAYAELLLSRALESPETALRGLAWIVGTAISSDVRDYLRRAGVLNDARYLALARRALSSSTDADLASAANLVTELLAWTDRASMRETIKAHDFVLRTWYGAISPENAWALGDLVNGLHHLDADYAAEVSSFADTALLAQLIPKGGWPHSSSTGHSLDRLCNVGGTDVRTAVQKYIDPADYMRMLRTGDPEFWRVCAFVEHVVSIDHLLALALFNDAAPRLARQLSADPVREWNDMGSLMIHFGAGPTFLRAGRRPRPEVVAAMRNFIRLLDKQSIAAALAGPIDQWGQLNFDEFLSLLAEFDPVSFKAIVEEVDLARFEESLAGSDEYAGSTAMYAALCIAEHRPTDIHDVLDRLEPRWTRLDPLAAACAPDVGVRALRRGLSLDLSLDHERWGLAAFVVERISESDSRVAAELIHANQEHMRTGLIASNHSDPWEDLARWATVCDRVAPGFLDTIIASLPPGAVAGWGRALKRPERYKQSRRDDIAPLVLRAATMTGNVRDEATQLLRKYPSVARDFGRELPE